MIDNGIANVKSNVGNKPTSDDFIFAGNIQKWEMFGNSLKLRLYNHLSKKILVLQQVSWQQTLF